MKMRYYSDTDSLYIELSPKTSVESKEIANGVVVDFDQNGNIIGIDIEDANQKLDLKELELIEMPFMTQKIKA